MSNKELCEIARRLRIESIKMIYHAKSGHCGGSLSAADIIAVLYWHFLNVRPDEPKWPERDRFILSKGHSCPVYYAALACRGFFEQSQLKSLRKFGTILQGHPSMKHTPGCDMSTGSLGQGLSIACGMALGGKHMQQSFHVYVLLSDGELDEGMVWEAAMFAHHYKLNNLTAIIDYNGLQLDGFNKEIMCLEPLHEKWKAFGWNVIQCDGHDVDAIIQSIEKSLAYGKGPSVIIAHTIKGKGISFMENECEWHGKVPDRKLFNQAMKELTKT